jgi:hypothetical protein
MKRNVGENERNLEEEPVIVLLRPPRISHEITR